MLNKLFSALRYGLLFGPATMLFSSVTISLLFELLCAKQRLSWITVDLLEKIEFPGCYPVDLGAWLLCPLIIFACLIGLFSKRNNRRVLVIAILANVLSLLYSFLGFLLPSLSCGGLIEAGNNRIEFNHQSEGMDLDNNFTQIETDEGMHWDGGWIAYRCHFSDTSAIYKWLKYNNLEQQPPETSIGESWQSANFLKAKPSWWPIDMSKKQYFAKQISKKLENNVSKQITISALLDQPNMTVYILIIR